MSSAAALAALPATAFVECHPVAVTAAVSNTLSPDLNHSYDFMVTSWINP